MLNVNKLVNTPEEINSKMFVQKRQKNKFEAKRLRELRLASIQEMPWFCEATVLCHQCHMMKSTMDTDTRSPVLMIHTKQEDDHLRKCQIPESAQCGCLYLKKLATI